MFSRRKRIRELLSKLTVTAATVAALAVPVATSAAPPAIPAKVANGTVVNCDIDKMAAHIKQAVHNKCVGYSVAIYQNGKLKKRFAGGLARRSVDSPGRAMSVNDQLELGSISKPINSMVLLKALEEKGISIHSSIYPYLPKSWSIHKSIKDGRITFRKLLSHRSGLQEFTKLTKKYEPGHFNDHVREAVKLGVVRSQSPDYDNINYELVRVLLAYVVNAKTAKLYEAPGKRKAQDVYISSLLAAFANTRVFSKAGIYGKPRLKDKSATGSAWYYNFEKPGEKGVAGNDRTRHPGRGGWKMTPSELCAIFAAWNANRILSPKMTADMKKLEMGIFEGDRDFGKFYTHNGKSHPGSRAATTRFMMFANANIQVALLTNSANNKYGSSADVVLNAYNAATTSPDLIITKLAQSGSPYYQDNNLVVPVIATVYNKGKADAKGKFVVGVKRFSKWQWLKLTDTLKPKNSRNVKIFVKIPDRRKRLDGRTIKLTAMADAPVAAGDTSMPKHGRVKETNESNNTKSLSMKVSVPKRAGSKVATKKKTTKKPTVRRPRRTLPRRKPTTKKKPTRRPVRRRIQ